MTQQAGALVKTTLYFDRNLLGTLAEIRDETGVPVSTLIRRAVASKVAERAVEPDDFSDIAIVRRALLNGGSWTISDDEIGRVIDGNWCDPLTGKSVAIRAIVSHGKAFHSSASIDRSTTFGVDEVLSRDERRAAEKALRTAYYKASRAGTGGARK